MPDSGVNTDVSKRKRRARPRNKDGTFGQSEAQKRRGETGIQIERARGAIAAGAGEMLATALPDLQPEKRVETARAVATIAANGHLLTKSLLDKINQGLKKNEGIRVIVETVPGAARYIQRVVMGDEEGVPHAVRLQAAAMVFEYAGLGIHGDLDDRDLSELSLDELNQRVLQMEHKLDVATSIPGESVEVGNAALLTPNPGETVESGTQVKRQAIE